MTAPTPFQLRVSDADLADVSERLLRTRFPDQAPGEPWAYGTDLSWMRELVAYWADSFDWRAQEAKLNAFPQFKTQLAGVDLHYLHVPGVGPRPMPLLLSHGWPGSVFEFMDLIPRLTDPARFGGDAADAFTVVAPSLPGYGLSFAPGQPRLSIPQMADAFAELMTGTLGYPRFATQGGDWGAWLSARIGLVHPDNTIGVHLNLMPRRDQLPATSSDPEVQQYLDSMRRWGHEGTGYSHLQGTRPQTLAFALTDSPAGLAAWIVEKMREWSDCGGSIESVFSKDQILANVALYWFTGAIGSSFWPYYAKLHGPAMFPDGQTVDVPVGYCEFPGEVMRAPRSMAENIFTDIRRWSVMPRGGHFAAMEQPEDLAREIRAFYQPLRG